MKLSIDILKSLINNSFIDRDKDNIYGECPKCGFGEFGISTKDNHLFGCFRLNKCGFKGNIFTLLKHIDRQDLLEAEVIRLGDKLEFELIDGKREEEEKDYDLSLPTIKPPLGFKRIMSNEYLKNRGFNSFDKFKVGTTVIERSFRDRVIFLIEEEGEIKAYLGRGVNKEVKPKYKNSTSDFAKLLLGVEEVTEDTKTIILVEGLLDKENVDRQLKLDDQDEIKCCCTFGAKISIWQILKMKMCGIEDIILFYENDVIEKIQNYAFVLKQEFEKVQIILPPENKDPGDMTLNEIKESLLVKYDPVSFFRKKMPIITLN